MCSRCRPHSNLSGLVVACHFKEGPIRAAIHKLKYGRTEELARILAGAVIAVVPKRVTAKPNWVVVPVPMSPLRERVRGYNQAEVLARHIADSLELTTVAGLVKVALTSPQAELKRAQRLINVRGSIGASGSLSGKRVILVDDVATTGATLEECARVLRAAGATRVYAAVVARAD